MGFSELFWVPLPHCAYYRHGANEAQVVGRTSTYGVIQTNLTFFVFFFLVE